MALIKQSRQFTLVLIVFSFLLSSCSTLDRTLNLVGLGPKNMLTKITIESTQGSNSNLPVAVDVIFIFEETLATLLINSTAPEWFQNKAALSLMYGESMKYVSADIVPLTQALLIQLPDSSKDAIAIIIFANYVAKQGQVAGRLERYKEVNIELNQHAYFIKTSS